MSVKILVGDCRDVLKTLPDESVHCVITSPPYYILRDYRVDSQIGLEPTMGEYIAEMVDVFREVRRVLRSDGTCWLNLGDSYANSGTGGGSPVDIRKDGRNTTPGDKVRGRMAGVDTVISTALKPKDLIGIPWRVALALQADGWWLRQDIIWAKPNPMPESVTDRCTKAHEYIFLLTKSARYFYDAEAIKEKSAGREVFGNSRVLFHDDRRDCHRQDMTPTIHRNRRSVWTIPTRGFGEAHFATFPPDLVEPMIKAGTSERGCCSECGAPWERVVEKTANYTKRQDRDQYKNTPMVDSSGWEPTTIHDEYWRPTCNHNIIPTIPCTVLDPFGGAGTTALVADRLGRDAILIELNPDYAEMARRRIVGDMPMFADVEVVT